MIVTDDELAHHIAGIIAKRLSRIEEPRDAAEAEVMRQDACEVAYATLTQLGATEVEFHLASEEDAIRMSFVLSPQHWNMVLGVDFSDEPDA